MATRIRRFGEVKDKMIQDIVASLATIAWKVALKAYRQHTYKNRTYNLHDSYGSAVYLNGVLVEDSIRHIERAYSKKDSTHLHTPVGAERGQKALDRFLKKIVTPRKSDYITVVIAASMWYAKMVESKGYIVLDSNFVKNEMKNEIKRNPELVNKMKQKYGIDYPTLQKWMGFDETYEYDL
jgi:hypothetical protein